MSKRPFHRALLLSLLAVVLLLSAACRRGTSAGKTYYCPMHPTYTSDRPGSCPICNMDLVEKDGHDHAAPGPGAAEAPAAAQPAGGASHAGVQLSPEGARLAGVRTAVASRERLVRRVRTVGTVLPDERRLYRVTTKISGWVEKLYVNFSGQFVEQGQPILAIYSPELLASQEEYLIARASAARFVHSEIPEVKKGGEDLVAAARRRLALLDVPEAFLAELEASGKARRTVDLLAPASGFVLSKEVLEGRSVEPGMELFTVNDLSHVWVEASFYEADAPWLAVGQPATLRSPYDRTRAVEGRISYIYPALDAATRTLRVRFDLANPGQRLKLGMYLDIEHQLDLGEALLVPDSAVLGTGLRQLVFVETEPGTFLPREVVVGDRTEGRAQILSGLSARERVAEKANFLLDSESRLRAAIAGAGAPGAAAPDPHAGHGGRP